MGYTTEFSGQFDLNKQLDPHHYNYLVEFAKTRRMKRDSVLTEGFTDLARTEAGLPIGQDAGFYVGGEEENVTNYNVPPADQPSLWCQWVPTIDGYGIEWDQSEKFYSYVEWLNYLVKNFLAPWGYLVNGKVEWKGEDDDDRGLIIVKNNEVKIKKAKIIWVNVE